MSVQAFVRQQFEIHCECCAVPSRCCLAVLFSDSAAPLLALTDGSICAHTQTRIRTFLYRIRPSSASCSSTPTRECGLLLPDFGLFRSLALAPGPPRSSTPVPNSTDNLLDRDHLSRGAPPPLAYEPRAFLPQPLARLEGGKEWMYARVTRIPDDDSVRPTTLKGTETPIRVQHALVAQVRFRYKGSKKDHVLEMESKVDIASVSAGAGLRADVYGVGARLTAKCDSAAA